MENKPKNRALNVIIGIVTLPFVSLGIYVYVIIGIGALTRLWSALRGTDITATTSDEISITPSAVLPLIGAAGAYFLLLICVSILAMRIGLLRFLLRFVVTFLPSVVAIVLIMRSSLDNTAYASCFFVIILWAVIFSWVLRKPIESTTHIDNPKAK